MIFLLLAFLGIGLFWAALAWLNDRYIDE